MKVVFAKNIGFCSGVKRAIDIAKISLKKDSKPVQFLGNLVHNEKVVEKLKKEGGKIIPNPKKIKSGTLILRAHGEIFNPSKIKEKILIRDAACPLVRRAQNSAKELFDQGYQVIIIGDKNHPEVRGMEGYTKNKAIVIENESQAQRLKKFKKVGVVAQTTQNLNKVKEILNIIKKKTKSFQWIDTLCPEVLSRQKELFQILKKVDGILVIGSRSSANTGRLVEIVKENKTPVWWINSLEKLKKVNFNGRGGRWMASTLGVVSGTSTPDWEIKKIKKWLKGVKQK